MNAAVSSPLSLLAEITYRCNLQCAYCYNPLDLSSYRDELDVVEWLRVIDEAAELGILQIHFSGGEPTLRPEDLVAMVETARDRGLYSNLITQGTFLSESLIARLAGAGLDHAQISVQSAGASAGDEIAGAAVHAAKFEALARAAARTDIAVTLNCVLHRANIDDAERVIALAEDLGIRRLELANAQMYGWAHRNRATVLCTRDQLLRADEVIAREQERLRGAMEIVYVRADYHDAFPKPCMNGWGRRFMTVAPNGKALPCPAAAAITALRFENVLERSLEDIWYRSESFQVYRGTEWMTEPCRSCVRRDVDFGGCRCQAFLLVGDAALTDPACSLSPNRTVVDAIIAGANRPTGTSIARNSRNEMAKE
ncbi:MAG TPA: pyrroloquinoline quinone biosynthesis protein PqqE [Candidatus Eremiobacteraceae bacterium]|nr:pyrroloquinoline quinone biosynthesis protein PqqE [Candidatus Eremiobacteraceae bacterium]